MLALLAANTARAEVPPPADCTDPRFARAAYQKPDFDCETSAESRFEAGGETYIIRALKNRGTDTPEIADQTPIYMEAAEAAMRAWPGMGLRAGHVTLVLYLGHDAVIEGGVGRETNAPVPQPMARATVHSDTECLILLPLTGFTREQTLAVEAELRTMIAHETLHCVQHWLWPRQGYFQLVMGSWWAEGMADALATAVYPLDRMTRAFIADFDRLWSETPLTDLAYETSPFFMWLWREERRRFDALLVCLSAGQPGLDPASVQGDCVRQTLGPNILGRFVQAYLDRRIVSLTGEPAGVVPYAGALLDGEGVLKGEAPPLALWRGLVTLGPGTWDIALGDGGPAVSGLRDGDSWHALLPGEPQKLTVACRQSAQFPVYALPLLQSETSVAISVTRTGQEPCSDG